MGPWPWKCPSPAVPPRVPTEYMEFPVRVPLEAVLRQISKAPSPTAGPSESGLAPQPIEEPSGSDLYLKNTEIRSEGEAQSATRTRSRSRTRVAATPNEGVREESSKPPSPLTSEEDEEVNHKDYIPPGLAEIPFAERPPVNDVGIISSTLNHSGDPPGQNPYVRNPYGPSSGAVPKLFSVPLVPIEIKIGGNFLYHEQWITDEMKKFVDNLRNSNFFETADCLRQIRMETHELIEKEKTQRDVVCQNHIKLEVSKHQLSYFHALLKLRVRQEKEVENAMKRCWPHEIDNGTVSILLND